MAKEYTRQSATFLNMGKECIFICEGYTELFFCEKLLKEHFTNFEVAIKYHLISHSSGGIVKWVHLKRQIEDTLAIEAPIVQLKDVPAIAKAAQETGFAALWTQETQHDPFLPCTLIAEHSASMDFGTAIAVSFSRSPANLAYTAWDLAAQSGGRFILGLGTQVKAHIERRFGMSWPESSPFHPGGSFPSGWSPGL